MARYPRFLVTLWITVAVLFQGCMGQTKAAFEWGFVQTSPTTVTTCSKYAIFVGSRDPSQANAVGTPPYYMISYSSGGVTTISLLGSDPQNLTWVVDQPTGSTVLLSVADASGNSGGQNPIAIAVTSGDTSCLPPPPPENITLTSNVTGSVQTCQPLQLKASGGQEPYTITIAASNSPVVTNVTLGVDEDIFTYINRANPNGQIIAGVSDANGIWGTGIEILQTVGNTDTTCAGLESTSSNSSTLQPNQPNQPDQPDQTDSTSGSSTNHTALILEIVLPIVGVILLLLLGTWFWCCRHRLRIARQHTSATPDPWMDLTAQSTPMPVFHDTSSSSQTRVSEKAFTTHNSNSSQQHLSPAASPYGAPSVGMYQHTQPSRESLFSRPPPMPLSETSSVTRRSFAMSSDAPKNSAQFTAMAPTLRRADSFYASEPPASPQAGMSNFASSHPSSSINRGSGLTSTEWGETPNIIVQHRDGGAASIIEEIPPPYLPSTSSGPSSGLPSGLHITNNAADGPSRALQSDTKQHPDSQNLTHMP